MALYKEIQQPNGVVTNYHRIVSMNIVTNILNIIEVASYTSQDKRQEEIDAIQNKTSCDVFINTTFKNADYNQDMTVETAYEWLKSLPEFADSKDV